MYFRFKVDRCTSEPWHTTHPLQVFFSYYSGFDDADRVEIFESGGKELLNNTKEHSGFQLSCDSTDAKEINRTSISVGDRKEWM